MAKIATEFEYDLSQPLSFHKGGELAKAKKLLLKAPSNMHRYHLTKLKQGFMKAIMGMQQNKKPGSSQSGEAEEAKFDAKVILMLLLASDIDFCEYVEHFKNLICSQPALCFIDGSVAFNTHLFDQLSEEDCEMIMGKYIETFLLSSWMNLLGIK